MTLRPQLVPIRTSASTSNYVYIIHDEYGWVPARLISSNDEKATVLATLPSGAEATITVKLSDYDQYSNSLPLQNVDPNDGRLLEVEDMVDLSFLHEAAILYNLKSRHRRGLPYTRTGDIVIAVNPYQWINGLYTPETQAYYASSLIWSQSSTPADVHPHVYETSSLAYRGLACQGQNQSILVSGESGAGKTETVKILMNHLASVQRGKICPEHDSIIKKVLDSNPLLEAFGNAKTARNDNSSRFGKFIQLQFYRDEPPMVLTTEDSVPSTILAGSKCVTYLLEKSRVVLNESSRERGYHIFYQLLAAPEEYKLQLWEKLAGKTPESFRYLGPTNTYIIEGKTDAERFGLTVEALKTIGIFGESLNCLMESMCIVLQLGNLIFEADPANEENSIITSIDELESLATLMGMEASDISNALTIRTVTARNEVYKVPLNAVAARDCCDAFAKEIYARVFDWLVRKNNEATTADECFFTNARQKQLSTIGLLDIFGFESFEVNRFEQLCINYANEKLQEKFTQDIFRSVQAEYEYEGIELDEVKFEDNAAVLQLVEGRMGLISVLNEECVRPRGNDISFVNKFNFANNDSRYLVKNKNFRENEFGIEHYVGPVVYDATNFVKKNTDTLPGDLKDCAAKCLNKLVREEIMKIEKKSSESPPGNDLGVHSQKRKMSGSLVSQTVSTKFKSQLHSLMHSISKTRTRYIRCIKPNFDKAPVKMDNKTTLSQLRCAGVVAALTISRVFPNRLEHDAVVGRFSCLSRSSKIKNLNSMKARENVEILLSFLLKDLETKKKDGDIQKAFLCGKTRVYFRSGSLEYLQAQRFSLMTHCAAAIQTIARGYSARKQFIQRRLIARETYFRMCNAATRLQSISRRMILREKFVEMKASCLKMQCWSRRTQACIDFKNSRRSRCATIVQSQWHSAVLRTKWKKIRYAATIIQAASRVSIQRPIYLEKKEEAIKIATLEYKIKMELLKQKLEEAEEHRKTYLRNARQYAWRNCKVKPMVRVRSINEAQIASSTLTPSSFKTNLNVECNPTLKSNLFYKVRRDMSPSCSRLPMSPNSYSRHLQAKTSNWDYISSPSSHASISQSVNTNGIRSLKDINLPKEVTADTISKGHQIQQNILTESKKMSLLIRDKMKVRVRGINDKHSATSMLSPISRSKPKQANRISFSYNSATAATSIPSLTPNSSLSSFDDSEQSSVKHNRKKKVEASAKKGDRQVVPLCTPEERVLHEGSLLEANQSASSTPKAANPATPATKQSIKTSLQPLKVLFRAVDDPSCTAMAQDLPKTILCSKLTRFTGTSPISRRQSFYQDAEHSYAKQKQIAACVKQMQEIGKGSTMENAQRMFPITTMTSQEERHEKEQNALSVKERVQKINVDDCVRKTEKTSEVFLSKMRKPSLKLNTDLFNQEEAIDAIEKVSRFENPSTPDKKWTPLSRLISPITVGFVYAATFGRSTRNSGSPSLRQGAVFHFSNEDEPSLSPVRNILHQPLSYQSLFSDPSKETCDLLREDGPNERTLMNLLGFTDQSLLSDSVAYHMDSPENNVDHPQSLSIEPLCPRNEAYPFHDHIMSSIISVEPLSYSELKSTSEKLDEAYQQTIILNDFWREMSNTCAPDYTQRSTFHYGTIEPAVLQFGVSADESLVMPEDPQDSSSIE